jgi:hypothetical protein
MIQRIKSKCRQAFVGSPANSGPRGLSGLHYVVWHDTEGGTAAGVAAMFHRPGAEGSANIVVDDVSCYRSVPDTWTPWGAPSFNTNGLHIEQCGYASWSRKRWLLHQPMLHRTAYKTAVWCKRHGIPPYFVDVEGLLAGHHGITTHAQITLYNNAKGLPNGGGHTDPGTGYPTAYVAWLVRHYMKGL